MQLDPTSDESFRSFLPGNQTEDDKALIVKFYVGPKLMGAKSEKAGRPIYEDREYVQIMIKGQDKQVVVHEVSNEHKRRFPIAYHLFKQQKPAPVVGTPIEMMPGVGPSMAHNLKGLNLRTVEDLANVSDENTLQSIGMGARDLVAKAKAWISRSTEEQLSLQAKNAELLKVNEALLAQLNAKQKGKTKARKATSRASA
jgi:hypothetical protein